ncbi:MAG TPA: hypothetical protein VLU46_00765, partial [Thermoanaerobaculia bacterium]|nr:hypothetical protein [Thermoanaerobaculia bacterium]
FTLFGAWALLFVWNRPYAAGALLGLAVFSEYPNAIPVAILVICAWRRLPRVALGGLPFAIALGAYNYAAFGSVVSLSSAHEADPSFLEMAHSGLFGVGVPSLEYLVRLLLDPSKGLFVFSPVLLIAFAGAAAAWRALPRASFVALVATPLSILLTFAGYPNWAGGWTVGARYLVAAVPFLCLLVAFAAQTWIEPLLLGASIGVTAVVTLVFPFVAPAYPAPWVSFAWPILRDGFVAPNVLHFVSRPLAIAVPFAIVLAALVMAVPRRAIAVALLGIVLWFGAGFAAVAAYPFTAYTRDFVEEVHFGKRGLVRNPALWVRARRTEQLPPPQWPF